MEDKKAEVLPFRLESPFQLTKPEVVGSNPVDAKNFLDFLMEIKKCHITAICNINSCMNQIIDSYFSVSVECEENSCSECEKLALI